MNATETFIVNGTEYVTIHEAARITERKPNTIRMRITCGSLEYLRVGKGSPLVSLESLNKWTNEGGPRRFPSDVAAARRLESGRRAASAQGRARGELTKRHPDEYHELFRKFRAEIEAERGPLPGDEAAS